MVTRAFTVAPDMNAPRKGQCLQQGGLSRAVLAHEKRYRGFEPDLPGLPEDRQ